MYRLLLLLALLTATLPASAQEAATVANARAAYERSNYMDAVDIATRVLRQDRNNVDALIIRARAYEASERYASAVPDYERVLAIDPTNAAAIEGRRRAQSLVRGAQDR